MRRRLLVIVVGGVLVGCAATGGFEQTAPSPRMMIPRAPESVQIISGHAPVRPFVEVGVLNSSQVNEFLGSPLEKIRRKAALVGCDAVMVMEHTLSSQGESSSLGYSSQMSAVNLRASCLMFTEPARLPPPPAAPSPESPGSPSPPAPPLSPTIPQPGPQ